jgi:hypothetical protein
MSVRHPADFFSLVFNSFGYTHTRIMDALNVYWWFFIAMMMGLSLELSAASSTLVLSSVSGIHSLSFLPQNVQLEGIIQSPHFSGSALVFELENGGRITCYHRHPSLTIPVFSGDRYRVLARIESTPKGKLCVVEEMVSIGFS